MNAIKWSSVTVFKMSARELGGAVRGSGHLTSSGLVYGRRKFQGVYVVNTTRGKNQRRTGSKRPTIQFN